MTTMTQTKTISFDCYLPNWIFSHSGLCSNCCDFDIVQVVDGYDDDAVAADGDSKRDESESCCSTHKTTKQIFAKEWVTCKAMAMAKQPTTKTSSTDNKRWGSSDCLCF